MSFLLIFGREKFVNEPLLIVTNHTKSLCNHFINGEKAHKKLQELILKLWAFSNIIYYLFNSILIIVMTYLKTEL